MPEVFGVFCVQRSQSCTVLVRQSVPSLLSCAEEHPLGDRCPRVGTCCSHRIEAVCGWVVRGTQTHPCHPIAREGWGCCTWFVSFEALKAKFETCLNSIVLLNE